MGDVGVLLLTMRLAPNDEIADELHRRVTANLHLPVMELMWGTPGTMLAVIFMHEMTGQDCWRQIYQQQAERLLGDLKETELGPLWTQIYTDISVGTLALFTAMPETCLPCCMDGNGSALRSGLESPTRFFARSKRMRGGRRWEQPGMP